MSSSHLCPCPACNRHVMTDAGVCPFCQTALPASFCSAAPAPAARGRMGRAAMVLAGATMAGVSACSSGTPRVIAPYGISPPFDAGIVNNQDAGSGAGGAAGNDGGTDTGDASANDASDDHNDGGASG